MMKHCRRTMLASLVGTMIAVAATAAEPSVTLKTMDAAGLKSRLTGLKGKIIVVDAWATWCLPCRKKFPAFLEAARKHGRDDVVFLTFANDEDEPDKVREFLEMQGSTVENILVTTELSKTQEVLQFEGVPHYFLYDRDGKVVVRSGEFRDVLEKLTEMLAAK